MFRSPSSGRIPAVPTHCATDAPDRSRLELEVTGSLADYATGTWTGDEITRHAHVDFVAGEREASTRTGTLEPASTLTIARWDSTGHIQGTLDLTLTGGGTPTRIHASFTVRFEAR